AGQRVPNSIVRTEIVEIQHPNAWGKVTRAKKKANARKQKTEATNQKPETKTQKREARNRKPEARSKKPEARSQKPEARSQKPEAVGSHSGFWLLGFFLTLGSSLLRCSVRIDDEFLRRALVEIFIAIRRFVERNQLCVDSF